MRLFIINDFPYITADNVLRYIVSVGILELSYSLIHGSRRREPGRAIGDKVSLWAIILILHLYKIHGSMKKSSGTQLPYLYI